MRYVNLVNELLKATGMKRPQLAKRLGKSHNLVGAWVSDPQPEEARQLAQVAKEIGRHDLEAAFMVMAGEGTGYESSTLSDLRGDEEQLAEWVVSMYRDPRNEMERAAIQLLWGLRNQRSTFKGQESRSVVDALTSDDRQILEKFLRNKDAMRIIATIASGGNPPKASELEPHTDKKFGERMAK